MARKGGRSGSPGRRVPGRPAYHSRSGAEVGPSGRACEPVGDDRAAKAVTGFRLRQRRSGVDVGADGVGGGRSPEEIGAATQPRLLGARSRPGPAAAARRAAAVMRSSGGDLRLAERRPERPRKARPPPLAVPPRSGDRAAEIFDSASRPRALSQPADRLTTCAPTSCSPTSTPCSGPRSSSRSFPSRSSPRPARARPARSPGASRGRPRAGTSTPTTSSRSPTPARPRASCGAGSPGSACAAP